MLDKYVKIMAAVVLTAFVLVTVYNYLVKILVCNGEPEADKLTCSVYRDTQRLDREEGKEETYRPDWETSCWCEGWRR